MFPTLVLSLLFYLSIRAEDGVSTGTDGWGMRVYVSKNPRECAPFHVYYDIDRSGDPPDQAVLPDAAALSFLLPDSSAKEWMVLRPPMGTGMLTWTCALPAGTQFAILNGNGFQQMFTVGPSESASGGSSSCWRNASSITSSSKYGSLNVSVYRLLLAASYTPISISTQFSQVEMPSTVGLDMIRVSLGAVGRDKPSSSSESHTPTKTTTGITPSATRLPQAPDGPPGSTTSPSRVSPSISRVHSKEPGDAPSTLSLSEAGQTQTHSPNPKGEPGPGKSGLIIGAVLAALALGAILGAFVVIFLKRRTKLKSHGRRSDGLGAQSSEVAQVSAFVVLSEGAPDRVRNSKRVADHDRDETGTGDPRTRTVVSEGLPSYRSSVEL